MKSLIVDDDLTSRMLLEEILSGFGEVCTATDGGQAVHAVIQALYENRPFDLICMDLLMPDVSGLEAIPLIRLQEERHECTRRSGIIVITSSEDTGSINAAFRQLADAYIVKPVDTPAFLNVVGCLCPMEVRPA